MTHSKVDVAIIGAGSAGLNAWRSATGAGAKALLLDPGPLGTTCARVGCMPSKLLIAASELAHDAARAAEFGVNVGEVSIDRVAVMARLRRLRDGFVNKTLKGYRHAEAGELLIRERARLVDRNTIRAGEQTYHVNAIVVATGSKPWTPPPYRDLGDVLLTNENVFELPELPSSMLVVGAGPIGLELGQAFHRLGVRVTVLDLEDRIAGLADPEVAEVARTLFKAELDMHLHHELEWVERTSEGVEVAFSDDAGNTRRESYQFVLAATGRRPNLQGLGLDALGLDPLPPVDPLTRQLGDSNIFVAGDATGDRMLLHEAGREGRVAGMNAAHFPQLQQHERSTPLALVFSDPQVAMVGKRWGEIDPERDLVEVVDFVHQARAKVLGKNRGRGRLYADASGKLLGAELLGPAVEHLGHLVASMTRQGLTASQALELPIYHPVVEEALIGPLRKIASRAAS
jgi:dihydrolipoamide dehydrogenase